VQVWYASTGEGDVVIEIPPGIVCDYCNGRGVKDLERCPFCNGTGKLPPKQTKFKGGNHE